MNKKGGKNAFFSLIYLLIYYVFKKSMFKSTQNRKIVKAVVY